MFSHRSILLNHIPRINGPTGCYIFFFNRLKRQLLVHINLGIFTQLLILFTTHKLRHIGKIRKTDITIIIQLRFRGFTSFSRDHNNAISTTRAINSCRTGIFQYINSFNIVSIDIRQAPS